MKRQIKKNKKILKKLQPHKKPVINFSTEIIPWIMLIITFPCLYIFKFSGGGWPPSLLQEKICRPPPPPPPCEKESRDKPEQLTITCSCV